MEYGVAGFVVAAAVAFPIGIGLGEIGARAALAVKRWRVRRYLGIDAETLTYVGYAVEAINAGPTDEEIHEIAVRQLLAEAERVGRWAEIKREAERLVPGLLASPERRAALMLAREAGRGDHA